MSGWSQRESMALAIDLGRQGATVIDRKNGWTVRFPDGKATMSIHKTPSDHRTSANYRAEVLRAGFKWPFDGEGFRKGGRKAVVEDVREQAAKAEDKGEIVFDGDTLHPGTVRQTRVVERDGTTSYVDENPTDENGRPWYPAHVTVAPRPAVVNIGAVRGGIVALRMKSGVKDDRRLVSFLRRRNVPITAESTRRVLYWLGYRYDPKTVRPVTRGNTGTWVLVPELDRSKDETLPMTSFPPEEKRAKVTPITTVSGIEVPLSTASAPVEESPTVGKPEVDVEGIEALRGGPVDLDETSALEVAEELLREAERERDGAMERNRALRSDLERAQGEVERLQGALARERSAPRDVEDGAWSVAAEDFRIAPNGVAQLDMDGFTKAGLEVRIQFRRCSVRS